MYSWLGNLLTIDTRTRTKKQKQTLRENPRWLGVPANLVSSLSANTEDVHKCTVVLEKPGLLTRKERQDTLRKLRKKICKIHKIISAAEGSGCDLFRADAQDVIDGAHRSLAAYPAALHSSTSTVKVESVSGDENDEHSKHDEHDQPEETITSHMRSDALAGFIKTHGDRRRQVLNKLKVLAYKTSLTMQKREGLAKRTMAQIERMRAQVRTTPAPLSESLRQEAYRFIHAVARLRLSSVLDEQAVRSCYTKEIAIYDQLDLQQLSGVEGYTHPVHSTVLRTTFSDRQEEIRSFMSSLAHDEFMASTDKQQQVRVLEQVIGETREMLDATDPIDEGLRWSVASFLHEASHFASLHRRELASERMIVDKAEVKPPETDTVMLEAGLVLTTSDSDVDDKLTVVPDQLATEFPLFEKALALEAKCTAKLDIMRGSAMRDPSQHAQMKAYVADEGDYGIECLPDWL